MVAGFISAGGFSSVVIRPGATSLLVSSLVSIARGLLSSLVLCSVSMATSFLSLQILNKYNGMELGQVRLEWGQTYLERAVWKTFQGRQTGMEENRGESAISSWRSRVWGREGGVGGVATLWYGGLTLNMQPTSRFSILWLDGPSRPAPPSSRHLQWTSVITGHVMSHIGHVTHRPGHMTYETYLSRWTNVFLRAVTHLSLPSL